MSSFGSTFKLAAAIGSFAATAALTGPGSAIANVPLTMISSDPFANTTSQHATEVEPDTFAAARRWWRRSRWGGSSTAARPTSGSRAPPTAARRWGPPGFLPGMTATSGAAGSPFERVSDASVAYDAAHGTWLVSSIPLESEPRGADRPHQPLDRWRPDLEHPGLDPAAGGRKRSTWTRTGPSCDNTPSSPFYGHCYTELDNFGQSDLE